MLVAHMDVAATPRQRIKARWQSSCHSSGSAASCRLTHRVNCLLPAFSLSSAPFN